MFGYYDIRGVWGKDITTERAERLGRAIRAVVEGEIALGRDVRCSSAPLSFHLARGLGGKVVDLGITTTPLAYFFAWKREMETLQVTASHNPPEYNGLKLVHANGRDWTHEEVEKLRELYEEGVVSEEGLRLSVDWDVVREYEEFYMAWEVPRMGLGFDPSNGAGYILIPLLKRLFDLKVVNGQPEGCRPAHPWNPLLEESRKDIPRLGMEVGLLLDGDADRLALFVDGRFIGTDELVAFLAERGLMGKRVALEVMMPLALEEYLKDRGLRVVRTPTGRSIIKGIAKREGLNAFAEYSGHIGFRDFNYIDDPLYVLFLFLEAGGRDFHTDYRPPLRSPVISLRHVDLEALLSRLEPEEVIKVDGVDARGPWGRIVVRESKTERGVYRVVWESDSEESYALIEKTLKEVVGWSSRASS